MLIGTVRNSSQRPFESYVAEKKSEMSFTLFKPTKEFSESFVIFLEAREDQVTSLVWSFLDAKDVGVSLFVNKLWKKVASSNPLWATLHERAFASENKVPPLLNLTTEQSLALSEVCKAKYLETHSLFSDRIGVKFYSEYFGDIGIANAKAPPIPAAFITRAKEVDPFDPQKLVKDTHLLVYVPKEITITVPAGSKLVLNEKGRLIEGLEAISLEERSLIVPMTINNLSMLTDKGLKKGFATGLYEYSWKEILDGPGDEPIKEFYWFYQRKDVEGLNLTYKAQTILAENNRYEVSPLIDRVLLNMFTYASSGAFVEIINLLARTSTSVAVPGNICQAGSWAFGSRLRLYCLSDGDDGYDVGVALGVPSGSSEAV